MAHALPTLEDTKTVYRRRARRYDRSARAFYLVGFRYTGYRRKAVRALGLREGDTVVEVGCGTGANLPLLRAAVGATGRVVGVDLTDSMLAEARARVERHGWDNVELVQADASAYAFPPCDGVLSTYALMLVPDYPGVVRRAAAALRPGGAMAVADFQRPAWWPDWLLRLAMHLVTPFGATEAHEERLRTEHPAELMRAAFGALRKRSYWMGAVFVAVARKDGPATGRDGRSGRKPAERTHPLHDRPRGRRANP